MTTQLRRAELFGTPIWQTTLPEFSPYHDKVMQAMRERWDAGLFEYHQYAFGYNTPTDIFGEESFKANPHYRVLQAGFRSACERILERREGYAKKVACQLNCIQAWIRLQTPEDKGFPWHHHIPAELSGVYFVNVPGSLPLGEGDLTFQGSQPGNIFQTSFHSVRPETGALVIFPSYLLHKPTPCPSATDWRIGVNMDAYVEWSR